MADVNFESGRKDAILRAAESVFASRSYEAASIRTIAAAAAVNPALIRYYFGAKDALYRAIFEHRYSGITDERLRRLDAVTVEPGSPDSVRAILAAWFGPFVDRLDSDDGRNFVRLLAREANDPESRRRGIVGSFLDPSARRCIARLAETLPGVSRREIVWGYQFCIAVMLSSVAGVDRVRILSDDPANDANRTPPLAGMIAFAAAGLLAMAGTGGRNAR